MMRTRITLQAGESAGARTSPPQPRLSWLTAIPARAGSAIMRSISCIMASGSMLTVAPTRTESVSGMLSGERSVEAMSVARPSVTSPSKRPTHMMETTPMGTLYSSTRPQVVWGSRKIAWPSAQATAGMATEVTRRATMRGSGLLRQARRSSKPLVREPWKVMSANSAGTTGLRRENTPGRKMPPARQKGTM